MTTEDKTLEALREIVRCLYVIIGILVGGLFWFRWF